MYVVNNTLNWFAAAAYSIAFHTMFKSLLEFIGVIYIFVLTDALTRSVCES